VTTDDMHGDPRWAGLGELLRPDEQAAVIAVPLLEGAAPVGVLTLVGIPALTRPAQVIKVATFGATAAAIVREHRAIADLRRVEDQMRSALTSRAEIDQAKGILMAQRGLTADEAFAELVRTSQHANVKLRDIARRVVDGVASTGQLPPASARSRRGSF
jgi:hypothetical protein